MPARTPSWMDSCQHALYRFPAEPRVPSARHLQIELGSCCGLTLTCLDQRVWLTYEGAPREVELRAGERHIVSRASELRVHGAPGALLSMERLS